MAAPPTKIFVGRLPLDAKQEDLRALFEKYGVITECDVLNRFGFVHMKSEEMAKRAIAALHNSEFMGSRITVEPSTGKKGAGGGGGGGGGGGRGGRSPGGGRGGGPVGRNGGFGGGRPSPYDRPRGLGDRYGPPGGLPPSNGGGYYEDFDMYGRRGPAPVSRDPYGPPSYERRGYEPAYGDRYGGGDRDRRPMPPMGGSPYDRRPPPSADYPPSRAGPEYRRRTPPPGPMGDTYGRFDRDVYEAVPSDPYGSRRYPGAAPLGDRDLPPRRY
ncbi:glycine-rich RNA-binding protein blt801-like isoform X1 [Daphnia pulicaria]|uniref:glycine-rich RNA-binding protein blt801-like isoform X1 n=1 Tax=Daphnia pulicaria TaxID=35523 RepID=UPI001EEAFCA1|nr:glycine-rich RNA-binding protein blt801-like isoform X1 [Daphnia pulicaria]XP_046634086.1 glycine-rich RNA-binding protein blt801-like isoform X1 [Daphnia pulicaria]